MLVSRDPLARVQLIDVRDLAEWGVSMMEEKTAGVFNALGPALPLTEAELLGAVRAMSAAPTTLIWAAQEWLVGKGVGPHSCMRSWSSEFGLPGCA